MLESLFNEAAGLKACDSIQKRLQHRCFPVKLAKFLRASYSTEKSSSGYFCGLTMFSKEFGAKTGANVSNKYQLRNHNISSVG